MPYADFIHLRVHSAYSLSEGAIKIKPLIELCKQQEMPAVAITDTGNLFGALEFAQTAEAAGIQPIIGCQIALRREEGENRSTGPAQRPDQLVLLAKDETGYGSLLKLISKSYLETPTGEAPQLAIGELAAKAEGLIALTGGPTGPVGRLLAENQMPAAEAMLLRLAGIFDGRLYVELQRHGLAVEEQIEPPLLDFAYRHGLPLVATNEVFFADETMFEAHDALMCIAEGSYVSETNRRRLTPEHYFKPAAAMRTLFADIPEAVDNSLVIARRCSYYPTPRKPILPPYPSATGRDEAAELKIQAEEGLERRLRAQVFKREMDDASCDAAARPYRERLSYELGVINQMGFAGYFLIVADFIKWAKSQGIPVGPGRGSGAGSVVAWALTITDLDPLRWGLLFERFLNPERVSMPDFDVDFCQDRRDEVIRYVQDRYGSDRVAQIITFGKLQARAVLRDVGRVLQMPYGQVDRICKLVPNNPANPVSLQQAIDGEPLLQQMRDQDETVARLISIALRLEGLYRHASTHAAGVVIGDRPLDELIPLYRDPRSEMPVTQFNMKWVEQAGLVKFDFLGLKTLTVLVRAVELLRSRNIDIDLGNLPLDDKPTFEMLGRGETTGVFQLEGSGMRDVLRKLKPDRFEDIIAVVALYRPGPMDNIPSYINRKHGREKPDYLHPSLEGILKETCGIMIYQEQVMQIAQELSGYTLGGADLLRRAMGKKIRAEMEAQRKAFIEGAIARGVEEAKAAHIFELVNKFAGYGFNKSHAAAYALVAYQTAYLKANYPVEFFAASMTLDLGNTDKLNVFRQELQRLNIELLPPDINKSDIEFSVEQAPSKAAGAKTPGPVDDPGAIRYALAAVKNVGGGAMAGLVAERNARGPFRSLADLANRLDGHHLNKRQLESLASAGTFDSLNPNRRQVFEAVEQIIRQANAATNDRASNQSSLFAAMAGIGAVPMPSITLAAVPDWLPMERLKREFEAIGFYLSAHPLDAYGKTLERLGVVKAAEAIARLEEGRGGRVRLAGTPIGKQERTSARGNRFAFLQLSDTSGVFEVTVFAETLSSARELIDQGIPLLIAADGRLDGDQARFTAQSIEPLDKAAAGVGASLRIYLDDAAPIESLKHLIDRESRGKGRIWIVAMIGGSEVEIALQGNYGCSPQLRQAIRSLPGIVEVEEV
ncbi:MAG TPA: DNA polymerase III subunit alpha [Alphaproteobacteria bacterium]|nr:DNA polymerase III subunit alpha [Alphaproteobacteria bacterium]